MSTHPEQSETPAGPPTLQVSPYDRVASMLVSLLILVGLAVAVLAIVWFTSRVMEMNRAVPMELIEEPAGRGEHAAGAARDLEEPGLEELPDVLEPQISTTLSALTDIVSSQEAKLEALEGNSAVSGRGTGQGDSRTAGEGGEGEDIVPRWERWEIRFSAASLNSYARQLDFFKIELGAIGAGRPGIDYASQLSSTRPATHSGKPEEDKRLYMTWRSGELQQADRQLLTRAGVPIAGRVVMQFYSPETENQLAHLELARAGVQNVSDKAAVIAALKKIRKTVFGVRSKDQAFEFYVLEQQPR